MVSSVFSWSVNNTHGRSLNVQAGENRKNTECCCIPLNGQSCIKRVMCDASVIDHSVIAEHGGRLGRHAVQGREKMFPNSYSSSFVRSLFCFVVCIWTVQTLCYWS
jgi:hypothetical protein